MAKKAVIFGTGTLGKLVHYHLTHESDYRVVAFATSPERYSEPSFLDLPVVRFDEIEKQFPSGEHELFIAVGYSDLNRTRRLVYDEAKAKGYRLLNFIHPSAIVAKNCVMGDNCFVAERTVIQPFVTIGSNVFLWSGNVIAHEAVIEDHCFLAGNIMVGGHSRIKEASFIGMSATIRDKVTVGRTNVIGMGCCIRKDTGESEVYFARDPMKHPVRADKWSDWNL
jgi:sugar O-acyltransferase (sialic acid O-acetyltransferase NeuD family)